MAKDECHYLDFKKIAGIWGVAVYWNAPSVCASSCITFFSFWGNGIISNMASQWWWIMLLATGIMMWGIVSSVVINTPLLFIIPYVLLCRLFSEPLGPIFLHLNKAYTLITAIIGDDATVCFQMKAVEMRGQLNATEKRSSETLRPFLLIPERHDAHWLAALW